MENAGMVPFLRSQAVNYEKRQFERSSLWNTQEAKPEITRSLC
jgi:hypothetical protein